MVECGVCGAMGSSEEDMIRHMVVQHADPTIDMLVTLAFREALQIAELEKLYAKQCH